VNFATEKPRMNRNKWTAVLGSGHPLAQLEDRPLVEATLEIMLGPQARSGARYFQIRVKSMTGETSQPLLLALHHFGPYPSYNWIEVMSLTRNLNLPEREVSLSEKDLERLLRYLSDLIPPGGHVMVEYESEEWAETRLSLACSIPPVATPLGSILFRVGCGVAFKDWHFAEGGSEGPRKLQGYKALNEEHRCIRAGEMAVELSSFLKSEKRSNCQKLWEEAEERAMQILLLLSTIGSREAQE
jgi:hypothetical protein